MTTRQTAHELLQILLEGFRAGMAGVQAGQGEVIPVLAQIVADRNLAAESIATTLDIESAQIIGIRLHQNGDIQARKFDGISHAFFVTEVGQHDQECHRCGHGWL